MTPRRTLDPQKWPEKTNGHKAKPENWPLLALLLGVVLSVHQGRSCGISTAAADRLAGLWNSAVFLELRYGDAIGPPAARRAHMAMLLVQSWLNCIGAWAALAWGQQYVDASLASVLNSTSPIFVFALTAFVTRHEALNGRKFVGTRLRVAGVL